MRRRIIWISACLGLALGVLVVRIFYEQVIAGGNLAARARNETTQTRPLPASRGLIYDRQGRILALDVPDAVIAADPHEVKKPAAEAGVLAGILHLRASVLVKALTAPTSFVYLDRLATTAQGAAVKKAKPAGVFVTAGTRREYPLGKLAAQVLGFVGLGGRPLAGVELYYQKYLAGKAGQEIGQFDAAGNFLAQFPHTIVPPVPGDSLQLTLDAVIQADAQNALQQAITKFHAKSGQVIVMDPNSGAILALAVYPTFDPNHYYRYPAADLGDPVVTDTYPPGSTFKLVTASAALATHTITTSTVFYDPGYKIIGGVRVNNWYPKGFGKVSFDKAVALSDDIYFMDTGLKLGVTKFLRYVHLFGINSPTGVDLPGEGAGIVLPAASVRPIDLANMSFGQTLTTTPIGLLDAACAVANGGLLPRPHVGRALLNGDGKVVKKFHPAPIRRVIPRWVAAEVSAAMRGVITSHGTGTSAEVPGYVLAGKTGTAQLVANGKVSNRRFMASFIGFGPLPNPKLAILVQILAPNPKIGFYGAQVAAPVWAKVMGESLRYLGIPPQVSAQTAPIPMTVGATVPDLSAKPATAAATAVSRLGLKPVVVGNGPDVLRQYPFPGTVEKAGTAVILLTARPAAGAKVVLPPLQGLDMREVADILDELNLGFTPAGTGYAVDTKPAAGTAVNQGTGVTVTFSAPVK